MALYPTSCLCFLPVFSTVNQNESDSSARRSISACCDIDTILAAQLSRISPIRGVKQFGQLLLAKAQAAVQQSAAQILLHPFSYEFPNQAYRYHFVLLTSVIRPVQLSPTFIKPLAWINNSQGLLLFIVSSLFWTKCGCCSWCRCQLCPEPGEPPSPPPCLTWWMP